MIRNGSALLGAGLLLAGLTAPFSATARSDDTALAYFLRGVVQPGVVHVDHHHVAHRGPTYSVPARGMPVHAAPSSKALKKHDAAYRKYEKEHIRLYGHAPRACHHYVAPRHHHGRR
jgi:hypothetical protein